MIVYGKSGTSFGKELYYDPSGKDTSKFSDWEKAKAEGYKLVDHFLGTFTGLRKWLEDTKKFAYKNGYVETMFGRRRRLPDLKSSLHRLRADAERQAINAPIQGTGSDLTLLSLIHINNYLKQHKMKSVIIATVHDSIVFDVYLPELPELAIQIQNIMEHVHEPYITTKIPILTDLELGMDYGATFEVSPEVCTQIYDERSFVDWIKSQNKEKYKKEIVYLKEKLGYPADRIFKYLLTHKHCYKSLVDYVGELFSS